jgi:hypothetical protein
VDLVELRGDLTELFRTDRRPELVKFHGQPDTVGA